MDATESGDLADFIPPFHGQSHHLFLGVVSYPYNRPGFARMSHDSNSESHKTALTCLCRRLTFRAFLTFLLARGAGMRDMAFLGYSRHGKLWTYHHDTGLLVLGFNSFWTTYGIT